ncbi:Cerebellar degeneration-related protein 2-like, partial [Frankliniella fusca]
LQLAAELGKTLLERNKELETTLRQQQTVIDDQTQEIEYLTKQTAALREVNDSRLRIYEQLEVSILDLERANQRLALDSAADKKHIKTLCVNIDSLEARCEELQKQSDELQKQLERKTSGPSSNNNTKKSDGFADASNLEDEVDRLRGEVQELKAQRLRDQRRSSKLEEQVQALVQENQVMEEQLQVFQHKEEDMKSLQEEITTLEEIRSGQLCGRCTQKMGSPLGPLHESLQLLEQCDGGAAEDGDEEDVSVIDSFVSDSQRASVLLQLQERPSENPYRDLVQKYEALVQIQSNSVASRRPSKPNVVPANGPPSAPAVLSLQEELQMSGDFNSFRNTDEESGNEDNGGTIASKKTGRSLQSEVTKKASQSKAFSTTPTDFSEAETSSSGFSDETSNKSTQTEFHRLPGGFLCTIVDGEDCRFSIYDDASPVDGRFRNTPEYRNLFREIFDILKKAAEARDEGEKLPLLDDVSVPHDPPRVPPVTPAKEELPLLKMLAQDGTQTSIISEEPSEICSEICSEIVADAEVERVTATMIDDHSLPSFSSKTGEKNAETGPVSSPASASASTSGWNANGGTKKFVDRAGEVELESKPASPAPKKDIMEYLAMGVGRKKGRSRKNSPHASPRKGIERVDPSNLSMIVGLNTRISHDKGPRRRRDRYADSPSRHSESPSRQSDSPSRRGYHSRSPSGHRNSAASANALAARCRREVDEFSSTQAGPSKSHSAKEGFSQTTGWALSQTTSTASQDIARLKKLEMSYADVLRKRPTSLPTSLPISSQPMVNKCTQVMSRKSYHHK